MRAVGEWWVVGEHDVREIYATGQRHARRRGQPEMVHLHTPDAGCSNLCMGFLP